MKNYTQNITALQIAGAMHKLAPQVESLAAQLKGFTTEGLDHDTAVKYSIASERLVKVWESINYYLYDLEELTTD